jgi:hypothetical protein
MPVPDELQSQKATPVPHARRRDPSSGRLVLAAVLACLGSSARATEPPDCRRLLARAVEQALAMEQVLERDFLLGDIAATQCRAGDDQAALATVQRIKESSRASRVRAGDDQVLAWAKALPSAAERGRALLGMAEALVAMKAASGRAGPD